MNKLRAFIAAACGIPLDQLPCFTLMDHDGAPAILVLHGPNQSSVWIEVEPDPNADTNEPVPLLAFKRMR